LSRVRRFSRRATPKRCVEHGGGAGKTTPGNHDGKRVPTDGWNLEDRAAGTTATRGFRSAGLAMPAHEPSPDEAKRSSRGSEGLYEHSGPPPLSFRTSTP